MSVDRDDDLYENELIGERTVCKYCYQKPIAIEAEFAKDCGWLPW